MSTAQNVARPATLPGASDAPTLDQLLYPPPPAPMPTDRTVSPSGQTGDSVMPTFGASTTQLDIYRIAFLAAGVLIGWKLLK
jgi:hypothetical protein